MNSRKIVEVFLPVLVSLFLLPHFVFAEESEPAPIIEIDVQGIIDSVNGMFSGLSESIAGVPQAVLDSFFGFIKVGFVGFVSPLFEVMKALILYNVDVFHFEGYWLTIVSIISCFYLLLFLVVGLKFLLGSYDAVQRLQAKEWFKSAVLLVIAVNASLLLYSLVLLLSSGTASVLWSVELEEFLVLSDLNALSLIWLVVVALFAFLAMITLIVRQIFLIVSVMLFPVAVFFYFIPPLKSGGLALLNLIFAFVFMQVLDVIILIGVSLFSVEFSFLPFVELISLSAGFLFMFLANLWLMFFAVMKALNIKVDVVQTVKTVGSVAAMAA